MEFLKPFVSAIITVIVIFFAGYFLRPVISPYEAEIVIKERIDTLTYEVFVPTQVAQLPSEIVCLPSVTLTDTIYLEGERDTVLVAVPMEMKTFQTPDYRAVISGYKPSLVSLEIYNKLTTEVVTKTVKPKFSHGIHAGVGLLYGTKGLDLGFAVTYGFTINF